MENKTITLYKTENVTPITFKSFFELMQEEIETYDKLGKKDELMNQPMIIEVVDNKGQIIMANVTDLIGWLEGGRVLSVSYYEDVYFEESK